MANPEPTPPRLVVCENAAPPADWASADAAPVHLRFGRRKGDVHLQLGGLTRSVQADLSPVGRDLVEVATFVYAADQVVSRGGHRAFEYGGRWRRRFRLALPVREYDRWTSPPVRSALTAALTFLTDDDRFEFHFVPRPRNAPERRLFDETAADGLVEEVCLFSGGLDSLCGAVEEVFGGKRRVALLGHRPCGQIAARQAGLLRAIRARVTRPALAPMFVELTANKGVGSRDFTQRSRSFLFASAAAAVASATGLRRVRFFENGITGLNLPVSSQLVGARASRTTHPQTLALFGALFSDLFGRGFQVDNPFADRTKAELLARLKAAGHADLAALTSSCIHSIPVRANAPHCGVCSQCVDRRVSVVAAGLADADDPPAAYATDPLIGARGELELSFAERYSAAADEMGGIGDPDAFAERYPEVLDAAPYLGGGSAEAGLRVAYDLVSRHAAGVRAAVATAVERHSHELARQAVPPESFLGVAIGLRAVTRAACPKPPPERPEAGLVVDTDRLEVRVDGRPHRLRWGLEFRLLRTLAERPGQYVEVAELAQAAWGTDDVRGTAFQRAVSNLRRWFRENQITGVEVDGTQRGRYALRLAPPGAKSV